MVGEEQFRAYRDTGVVPDGPDAAVDDDTPGPAEPDAAVDDDDAPGPVATGDDAPGDREAGDVPAGDERAGTTGPRAADRES